MKTPTEFLLLLILGIGALQKLTTRRSGRLSGPRPSQSSGVRWCQGSQRNTSSYQRVAIIAWEGQLLPGRAPHLFPRGLSRSQPPGFPQETSYEGRSAPLSPAAGQAALQAGVGGGVSGCSWVVGRSRKHPGDFREQRFGWKSKCSCIYIWNRGKKSGISYPLKYSHLENLMDRGAWWATVLGVEESRVQLINQQFHFSHFRKSKPNTPVALPGASSQGCLGEHSWHEPRKAELYHDVSQKLALYVSFLVSKLCKKERRLVRLAIQLLFWNVSFPFRN